MSAIATDVTESRPHLRDAGVSATRQNILVQAFRRCGSRADLECETFRVRLFDIQLGLREAHPGIGLIIPTHIRFQAGATVDEEFDVREGLALRVEGDVPREQPFLDSGIADTPRWVRRSVAPRSSRRCWVR